MLLYHIIRQFDHIPLPGGIEGHNSDFSISIRISESLVSIELV